MNVLITGAQFGNKGAQSMLFTVMDEVKERYPNADFYYLPIDYFKEELYWDLDNYRFHFVVDDMAGQDFPAKFGAPQIAWRYYKIRKILRAAKKNGEALALSDIWNKLDVLIDVSGYSLTSKFGISSINRVLRMITTAKSYGLKVILLPQSYGPFDFKEDVRERIGNALKSVDLLFARETDGMEQLRDKCGVTNVKLSPDIVLQTKEIDWRNVFSCEPKLRYPILETSNNVGIVPNGETFRNDRHDSVIRTYQKILKTLREQGKEVYIFRHSNDLPVCREIYELVKEDSHCHLIEEEIDCLSYGHFVRQFDFIIASRFHSIVHAYREGIPALVLGWAIKYEALTELMKQEQYVFDVTAGNEVDEAVLIERLNKMIACSNEESKVILQNLKTVQENNCFDTCRSILDSIPQR